MRTKSLRAGMTAPALLLAGFALAGLVLAGCTGGKKAAPAHAGEAAASQNHGTGQARAQWSYDNQVAWAAQSPEAAVCAAGRAQSPVDLKSEALVDLPNLVGSYSATEGKLFNNGHTIEISAAPGQTLNIGADVYQLVQAHFHSPSEHHLDGKAFPMEAHLVHRNEAGKLAVLGVFIAEGAENPQLAQILAAAPSEIGEAHARSVPFDPVALLPDDQTYFGYDGSLTTPPCSEGVRWSVLAKPITASAAQIDAFRKIIPANARDLQKLNERTPAEGR